MPRRCLALAGLGLALAGLTGCQRQFTKERFDMIRIGVDDREDVRQIIGEPTADLADQWLYDDLDHHQSARIFFDEAGRVRQKEWMDSLTGQWEGHSPNADKPRPGEVRERSRKTRRIDDD